MAAVLALMAGETNTFSQLADQAGGGLTFSGYATGGPTPNTVTGR